MAASAAGDDATSPPGNADDGVTRPLDVLTVGDGNFSFSLAFLRKHGPAIRLVATSFDSFDELVAKYPESARLCAQLRELGATVLHRVDATNLQVSLRNAVVSGEDENKNGNDEPPHSRSAVLEAVHERFFDRVIFNHPHCGEENVLRHQSLLSHFYVAAQRVLRRGSGLIHVTFAEGQPTRWEARERAAKAGLAVVHEIHDVDADDEYAVSYERKRHQNGRSFHRVLLHGEHKQQASTLFVLAAACDAPPRTEESGDGLEASLASAPTRKRKLPDAVPPTAEARAIETVSPAPAPSPFVCEPCAKSFKTAQGLKTHVHMVHDLGVAGDVPSVTKQGKSRQPCDQCERSFRTDEALRQHQISKHGEDGSIRPDWFRPLAPTSLELEPTAEVTTATHDKTCSICGLGFADEASFNAHWQELQPKAVTRRTCSLCQKSFEEERALRQHQNFCRAKAKERKESVGSSR